MSDHRELTIGEIEEYWRQHRPTGAGCKALTLEEEQILAAHMRGVHGSDEPDLHHLEVVERDLLDYGLPITCEVAKLLQYLNLRRRHAHAIMRGELSAEDLLGG